MKTDSRKYPRAKTSLDVVYYTKDDDIWGRGRVYYFGSLVDMSRGGMKILTDHAHHPDEKLWLGRFNDSDRSVPGRVCWTNRQRHSVMGVEFLEPIT